MSNFKRAKNGIQKFIIYFKMKQTLQNFKRVGFAMLLCFSFSSMTWAGDKFPGFTGSGTASDPYQVKSKGDLLKLVYLINDEKLSAKDVFFKQTEDIDLATIENWEPIGYTEPLYDLTETSVITTPGFEGTYDGNGHKISNLTMPVPTENMTAGLFGTVTGTIQNLWMDVFSYDGYGNADVRTGAICGQLIGGGTVQRCQVTGSHLSNTKDRCAGMIVGCVFGGYVLDCISWNNNLTGSIVPMGWITGDNRNDQGLEGVIHRCYTNGRAAYPASVNANGQPNSIIKADDVIIDVNSNYYNTALKSKLGTDAWFYVDNGVPQLKVFGASTSIKISNLLWATYYNSQAYELPFGVKAGILEEVSPGKYNIDFRYLGGDVVPAGSALILKAKKENTYTINFVESDKVADTDNLLLGSDESVLTYAKEEGDFKFYKLAVDKETKSKVAFYWGNSTGSAFKIAAHKAWLAVKEGGAVAAKAFNLNFNEDDDDVETTGIVSLEKVTEESKEAISVYNLSGQKVANSKANLPAGIYVINGRKVVIK